MEKPAFHLRTRKRRKLFTIRIDPEVLETAKELGLNISRTCEECLKQQSNSYKKQEAKL